MTTAPTDPMIGRLIDGRYQVRSRIARGGMATVYLATDLRLERRVAIKIMHGHLADDTSFKSRFVQEARSAARLAHPNVVNVFDQGQDSDMAYLVMEYLPGITLRELLKDYGKLTPEQAIDIMEAVLAGLAAAHRAGIVHRDLKPENVLLADDGRIKIGDFGLARAATANTATGQALLGTIAYLSPELVTRGIADARSDIYALGIMLYEMLTGEQPFQGEQPMQIAYQHANDSVPTPSSKNPAVPAELDELVMWATAKAPEHRPADAGAMLDRLIEVEKVIRGEQPTTTLQPTMVLAPAFSGTEDETRILNPAVRAHTQATAPNRIDSLASTARRRKGKGWWLFLLVLLLAAGAGGTGWYFGQGPGSVVTLPSLKGADPASATTQLKDLGLAVDTRSVNSLTVAQNKVVETDPPSGTGVNRGSAVTILISAGPKPIELPALAGLTQADATAKITALKAKVATPVAEQFSADVAKGVVISAATADGTDVSKGGASLQGARISLVVSLGPVPDVTGKTFDEAVATLASAGLKGVQGSQDYSDTVPDGSVISAAPATDGPVHKGDEILLNTSKGPQLFPLPDVSGKTINAAKAALEAEGYVVTIDTNVPKSLWGTILITSTDPAANTPVKKGSAVTVKAQY
ncbi:Stk1 family PASTA domain-containing Ser/Thr kinase [Microbacterium sp. STN6]|uniref:Stk1 family PASTA domain-containing Ser/Thr kinase n=1 Tax=Microbacterium sp. STN6 TaxID=2995588 RepID=UPI002260C780|nr:Stk1 family PASTA domain-containing Ser/Thr kinase [Microbacterium sp. STN6]MCX7521497.1 Stk1 family PASTA domain-containing Ser/Thr kinase [Microbacterium sp. STN6]